MPMIMGEAAQFGEGAGRWESARDLNPEERLIRDAQNGNVGAFNALVHTYQHRAFRVAYQILGLQEMAADATQEAFLSAYRHINRFRGGSFKAWLITIVTNACYDQLRKKEKQHAISLDGLLDDPERPVPGLAQADLELPPEQAERHELNEVIQRSITALPFDQRVMLVLVDVEGYSYEQAAEITAVNLGTVKSRLSRGRSAVRQLLLAQEDYLPARYRRSKPELD